MALDAIRSLHARRPTAALAKVSGRDSSLVLPSDLFLATMAQPQVRVSKARAEIQRYTPSGVPIKFMTAGLLALTTAFAYDLWMKKKFPHQHGVSLFDCFRR